MKWIRLCQGVQYVNFSQRYTKSLLNTMTWVFWLLNESPSGIYFAIQIDPDSPFTFKNLNLTQETSKIIIEILQWSKFKSPLLQFIETVISIFHNEDGPLETEDMGV